MTPKTGGKNVEDADEDHDPHRGALGGDAIGIGGKRTRMGRAGRCRTPGR